MVTYDGMLLRDTLSDTGVTPSSVNPFHSPDMINHAQVQDPTKYFADNYGSDPNVALEYGQDNFIYGRAKNLSANDLGGTLKMYWSQAGLSLNTGFWSGNGLQTVRGNSTLTLPSVAPGAISVGTAPEALDSDFFVFNPTQPDIHYCFVGMIETTSAPNPVPPPFTTFNAMVSWIANNQNVGWRNLVILDNYPDQQSDQLSRFTNIEDQEVPILFTATASDNVPVGTTLTLSNSVLNMNTSGAITTTNRVITASAICPANFSGFVETMGRLPNGITSWPHLAWITTKAYVGVDSTSEIAKYAHPWEKLNMKPADVVGLSSDGVLVEVGNTSVLFSS